MQYLKGSSGQGILFRRETRIEIEAHTDVDYAGSVLLDRRSASKYCNFIGGNLMTLRSKKAKCGSKVKS